MSYSNDWCVCVCLCQRRCVLIFVLIKVLPFSLRPKLLFIKCTPTAAKINLCILLNRKLTLTSSSSSGKTTEKKYWQNKFVACFKIQTKLCCYMLHLADMINIDLFQVRLSECLQYMHNSSVLSRFTSIHSKYKVLHFIMDSYILGKYTWI